MADAWKEYELGELLSYEQPTPYIVESTDYNDKYKTPVLTAGKTFILGYTNEENGVYDKLPVIIFDDFTTASQYVNFRFKVKSSAMKILKADTSLVLPKFIYYRMQSIKFDHSTHKRYWIQHYSKIKVSVPSIPEQERIVARIEELFSQLDASVADLKTVKERLQIYRQAVLKEAFEGKYAINPFYEIKRICDFANVGTGATPLTSKKEYYNGNIPWVTSSKINEGKIYAPTEYITELAIKETNCKVYPAHTLLIAMYGEGKTRGKCAELMIPAATNQALAAIEINENEKIYQPYLKWFLTFNYQNIRRKASGGVQPNLNLGTIKNICVPIYGYDSQKNIVNEIESRLSVCDSIEQIVDTALQQAEALRQSILKQAFEGKL
jgi:type I restriction enzyme S subunit